MKENLPQRKNIRLKQYDYSQEGYYFVTICTNQKKEILSKIQYTTNVGAGFHTRPQKEIIIINTEIGKTIKETINYINNKYKVIHINYYVIMPNHIHMIIENKGRVWNPAPTKYCNGNKIIYK